MIYLKLECISFRIPIALIHGKNERRNRSELETNHFPGIHVSTHFIFSKINNKISGDNCTQPSSSGPRRQMTQYVCFSVDMKLMVSHH